MPTNSGPHGAANLLSEISEEDTTDVISMVSERRLALKKQETEAAAARMAKEGVDSNQL